VISYPLRYNIYKEKNTYSYAIAFVEYRV